MKLPAAKSEGAATLRLHLKVNDIPFTEEHRFHPTRRWRFDFALPDRMLAVEVNGGLFTGGGHNRGKDMEGDYEKNNAAVLLGWRILYFSTGQVRAGLAIQTIREVLA